MSRANKILALVESFDQFFHLSTKNVGKIVKLTPSKVADGNDDLATISLSPSIWQCVAALIDYIETVHHVNKLYIYKYIGNEKPVKSLVNDYDITNEHRITSEQSFELIGSLDYNKFMEDYRKYVSDNNLDPENDEDFITALKEVSKKYS